MVTIHSVSSTSSASNYPVSNLANPATHLKWEVGADSPASTYTYITVNFASQSIDYVAIARHNLGTMGTPVAIGTIVDSPGTFSAIISDTTLTDDNPVIVSIDLDGPHDDYVAD